MNKFKTLKPELKALLFVITFVALTFALASIIHMLNPAALMWISLAFMIWALYSLAVGYFKFSDGVDNLNTKHEDKK
jgi:hypothetical protein